MKLIDNSYPYYFSYSGYTSGGDYRRRMQLRRWIDWFNNFIFIDLK